MPTHKNQQQGSKNYERFLKFYRFVSRSRDRGLFHWVHGHQRLAIVLIILLGLSIFLFLIGFLLTGINMVG